MSTPQLLPPKSALTLYNHAMSKKYGKGYIKSNKFSEANISVRNEFIKLAGKKSQLKHFKRPANSYNLYIKDYIEKHKLDDKHITVKFQDASLNWKSLTDKKKDEFKRDAKIKNKELGYISYNDRVKRPYVGYTFFLHINKLKPGDKNNWEKEDKEEWTKKAIIQNKKDGRIPKIKN